MSSVSERAKTKGSQAHEGQCVPDQSNTSKHQPEFQAGQVYLAKRQARPRQRRKRRAIQDIIREMSPSLDAIDNIGQDLQVMKNVSVQDNATTDETAQGDDSVPDPLRLSTEDTAQPLTDSNKRLVQCNICKKRMTESRLANHIRLLHLETEPGKNDENSSVKAKKFRCETCGKSYASKYTYEQHLKTHTEGRPKCPECGSTFASSFSLFRHRAKAHNIEHNYKTHSCDSCDKVFFSSSELKLHKQRHTEEKNHECPECKRKFSAKGNLMIHMRTHAKEKPFKCDICDSSLSHPYSLVTHRRIHTNDLPFKCDECGKFYRSKHQLASHSNVHKAESAFSCDKCPKTFRSRTAFNMHQDEHNGVKRFSCQYCDRKFQCQANKSKHERRHVGIKRFRCEKCGKGFIERQELNNHLRVHARQEAAANRAAANRTATSSKS